MIYMRLMTLTQLLLQQSALQQEITNLQQQVIDLQQQVITLQQQVIDLQQKVSEKKPEPVSDEAIFWHRTSEGIGSYEASQSDDVALLRRFRQWNVDFATRHIKPYVNPKVFGECLNQMTRGLNERIRDLEKKGSSGFGAKGTVLKLEAKPSGAARQAQADNQLLLMP